MMNTQTQEAFVQKNSGEYYPAKEELFEAQEEFDTNQMKEQSDEPDSSSFVKAAGGPVAGAVIGGALLGIAGAVIGKIIGDNVSRK